VPHNDGCAVCSFKNNLLREYLHPPEYDILCGVPRGATEGALAMDYLWSPWRYQYIAQVTEGQQVACVFCHELERGDDEKALIIWRGAKSFIILNRFPYTSGHVMIVPYAHVAELQLCDAETTSEMMELTKRMETALFTLYKPDGTNLGMNLGKAAGAGITGHLHLHVLPRWFGDTNFMTVIGETRVHPEELAITYQRLRTALTSVANSASDDKSGDRFGDKPSRKSCNESRK
jgi:ATP adenylyltransferase